MPRIAITIEAILFLKGQPVSLAEIVEIAKCDRSEAKEAIIELMSDYAHRDSALEILETTKGYSLQLKEEFANLTQTLIPAELGVGALRTLAAIALKGGIAQPDLIELRGSGAYQHVQELVELGFVKKRKQADSRSYWLQVTDKFHQYFQLDQLPKQLNLNLAAKIPDQEVEAVVNQVTDESLDLPVEIPPDEPPIDHDSEVIINDG